LLPCANGYGEVAATKRLVASSVVVEVGASCDGMLAHRGEAGRAVVEASAS
jgi:hypothetical protein